MFYFRWALDFKDTKSDNVSMSDWTGVKNNPDLPDDVFKETKESYMAGLTLPQIRPARQFLLCPVGVVGSGKTTVIKPLAERLDIVRVSTDEIRKIVKEKGFNYAQVKNIAYEIIKELLDKGYSVAVDGNCGSEDAFNKIKELEKSTYILVIWLRIDPPHEFIINKLKNYEHTWLFRDGDEAVRAFEKYLEKYGDFSNLDISYDYTFDPSKDDLENQLAEAEEIIKNRLDN